MERLIKATGEGYEFLASRGARVEILPSKNVNRISPRLSVSMTFEDFKSALTHSPVKQIDSANTDDTKFI